MVGIKPQASTQTFSWDYKWNYTLNQETCDWGAALIQFLDYSYVHRED